MSEITISRPNRVVGEIRVPSDKSTTHRSLMLGGLVGARIRHPLMGRDCAATAECIRGLGCEVDWNAEEAVVRTAPWRSPDHPLDCGNSGTTIRLLSGLVAGFPITTTLTGDASLSRRPMGRITDPLRQMGARIEGDRTPLRIEGGGLKGIAYASPVASGQIKSCVLFAGLNAEGTTELTEPAPSRDHTERMLRSLGATLTDIPGGVRLEPGPLTGTLDLEVFGDISSAVFWAVLASATPNAQLMLRDVGVNPTRSGMLEVLQACGADFHRENKRETAGEPVTDLVVDGSSNLRGFTIEGALVPRLIDEIPALAVLATQCRGTTTIRDAAEMRVKETDRIEVVTRYLAAMGAKVEATPDGMVIEGPTRLQGTTVDSRGDHRIGMAFAIAGCLADGETTILNADEIGTSYPAFMDDLRKVTA
ncbi:3-phosphoshikimate 1-carboxyvinyltransferase [soil metagenome]